MDTFKHTTALIWLATVLCAITLIAIAGVNGPVSGAASPAPSVDVTLESQPAPELQANLAMPTIRPPSCSCRPQVAGEEYSPDGGWSPVGASRDPALGQLAHFE
jgi:hypothetical protein